jgi:Ribose/xylose/arabinose/galactoside ABC-type transport systems, permease components
MNRALSAQRPAMSAARLRLIVPWIALLALYVVTVIVSPGYLRSNQLGSLIQLASILGMVAIGQTLVILIAGIDLSVGAVATLANLMSAAFIDGKDANLPLAILVSVGVGMLVGFANGLIITALKVPDLVATLATMTAVIGIGYLVTNGAPRGASSPLLTTIMTSRFAGVLTWGSLVWGLLVFVVIALLRRFVVGRRIYAVGFNRAASHVAGISVNWTVIGLYTASGFFASVAGVMLTGYTGSSFLGSGDTYQLATIAAVVLGGASIFGGYGGYGGTVAGVFITVLLVSILQVIGIPQAGQNIVYGLVILIMLAAFTPHRAAT